MSRLWAFVFLAIPVAGVSLFVVAPHFNWWLPPDISDHGHTIDHLFYTILWLVGVVFVATEFAMFWFLWRYSASANKQPVKFVHGSHTLEVVWTILPAATLLFIAIYQMNAWAANKIDVPHMKPTLEVTARQFEWRLRYPYTKPADWKPGDPYEFGNNDIYTVNDLHVPLNEQILVELKSQDVLHSFFVPVLRVKQDAVPGMKIPVWFKCKEIGIYDIPCAELCGWGHYKMKGRLTVQSREDYDVWLKQLYDAQEAYQDPVEAGK